MSFVELSKPNTDVVNIEIRQENNSEAAAHFRLPFLLPNTDYVVGVTSLSVPIQNTTLYGPQNPILMYIRRRNVGQNITQAPFTDLNGNGNAPEIGILDAQTLLLMDIQSMNQ